MRILLGISICFLLISGVSASSSYDAIPFLKSFDDTYLHSISEMTEKQYNFSQRVSFLKDEGKRKSWPENLSLREELQKQSIPSDIVTYLIQFQGNHDALQYIYNSNLDNSFRPLFHPESYNYRSSNTMMYSYAQQDLYNSYNPFSHIQPQFQPSLHILDTTRFLKNSLNLQQIYSQYSYIDGLKFNPGLNSFSNQYSSFPTLSQNHFPSFDTTHYPSTNSYQDPFRNYNQMNQWKTYSTYKQPYFSFSSNNFPTMSMNTMRI